MAPSVRGRGVRLLTIVVWIGLCAGCTANAAARTTERDAEIYQSVIADIVDQSGSELARPDDVPLLFIEAFDADGIPLEVQVAVVAGFVEDYEIRFIDDRDEALDIDETGQPVRAGSLLIGLGPIVMDRSATIRSELYMSDGDVRGYHYTLTADNDGIWNVVVGSPQVVDPEGFVSVS